MRCVKALQVSKTHFEGVSLNFFIFIFLFFYFLFFIFFFFFFFADTNYQDTGTKKKQKALIHVLATLPRDMFSSQSYTVHNP